MINYISQSNIDSLSSRGEKISMMHKSIVRYNLVGALNLLKLISKHIPKTLTFSLFRHLYISMRKTYIKYFRQVAKYFKCSIS